MKSNIVLKSIILSLMVVSFTACGGGGGGGGSSSGGGGIPSIPTPDLPKFETEGTQGDIDKNITNSNSSDGGKVINGSVSENISNRGAAVIGVKGTGNITLNGGNIEINDQSGGNTLVELKKIGEGKSDIDNLFSLDGYSFGIYSKGGNVAVSSESKITLSGDSAVGIYGENLKIQNNGIIETTDNLNNVIGIFGKDTENWEKVIINTGNINLSGNNAIGIKLYNATASNTGNINIVSSNGIGMSVVGNGTAINNGKIIINGTGTGIYAGFGAAGKNNGVIDINGDGYGMYSDNGGYIYNEGTININSKGYGMYVKNGGYAENKGVINLSSRAQGGMVADGSGSVVENKGTINVDSGSSLSKNEVVKAVNGGRVINSGNIVFKDKATIYSVDGEYVIGTSQDGSYGKIIAENIEIDGNVAIDSGIAKGSYKDSYTLDGVLEGNVEFGEDYKVLSDSLLYDAEIVQGADGDYDGKLQRNDKVISDFTKGDYTGTAKLFDKYFSEEEYSKLSEEGKNIIDSINIQDETTLQANIKDLTPTLYANNSRIISDIGDIFKEQREKTISTLGEYNYNFSFIGNYTDVGSEGIIEGYDSQMTGFVGSMKISEESYLSLGYGYTDIDFDGESEESIHSIHLGVDGYKNYGELNLQYGIGGEYNFHEIDREMRSYNIKGESDFDSYGLKTYGKISKSYKSVVELEPFISLNLGYYHVDNISEKSNVTINVAEENYLSIKPELGLNLVKDFENIEVFGGISYSYELGNMDKRVDYSYEGIAGKNEIKDNQENGLLTTKIGVNFTKNSFTFGLEGGKNFGKRDNSFVSGSIGYRF